MSDNSDDLLFGFFLFLLALPVIIIFAYFVFSLSHKCPTCDEYDSLHGKYNTVVREKKELERANEHMQTVINSYQLQEA